MTPVCTIQQPTKFKYWVADLSAAAHALLNELLYAAYRNDYGMTHMECLTALIVAQDEKIDNLDNLLSYEQRNILRNMESEEI